MAVLLFMVNLILTIISSSHSSCDQFSTKSTTLKFYFHDTVSGPNQSAWPIVQPKSGFGSMTMFDDPLTMGPESNSKPMGRAQGVYASADSKTLGLLMVMTFVFNEESGYENSTLIVLGRNEVFNQVREMPVVGGTGAFRSANGYAQAKTYDLNQETAVVEYNVQFFHF